MTKKVFQVSWILFLGVFVFFNSCEKDTTLSATDVDNYTEESVYVMQRDANCGKFGCFEFVFPLTVIFPDDSEAEVGSYDELRSTIRAWKEANPDATSRPSLAFPVEVTTEDGEVISVADQEELHELKKECRKSYYGKNHHRDHKGRGDYCFEVVFPLTIEYPDGTTAEAIDADALKELVRAWKEANGRDAGRPHIAFPIQVEMEDGSIVDVESREALKELKTTCSGDE